ncbi:DUF11 domain-containing protein [Lysinibacter cavernae]|uniref:Putative repeat protein (TIGR01451 family) n=1 Tax=Lysinibacter cavernae TaxID=1640652 RepID=A0A7X5R1K5_9MICO|nr:DUF11 domain-containing protein [Lysinibacter cavernae]NIH53891.1 putative repeat protein (TIGR01451 family) [Lysinibacter cavernae]
MNRLLARSAIFVVTAALIGAASVSSAAFADTTYEDAIGLSWSPTGPYEGTTTIPMYPNPRVVPGDTDSKTVWVRNDGPAEGQLKATITNVVLGGDVNDQFYKDFTINGQQVFDYNGVDTQVADILLPMGDTTSITVNYEFPEAATSGNYKEQGTVSVHFDLVLSIAGPEKELHMNARAICQRDVARVFYDLETVGVENPDSLPVTATWRQADGTLVRVDTIPAGQTSGSLLWPGAVVNDDDIAVGWPGWRVVKEGETPDWENYVYDPTLDSTKWREPLTITFEMNPTDVVTLEYPPVSPAGCEVPRDPGVYITKVASVGTVAAGSNFDYTIEVGNTGLGAVHPVTLSDPIPGNLKVNTVSTAGAPTYPRWDGCAVTGANSAGYGGTLNCTLNGYLGYNEVAPAVVLNVTVNANTPSGSLTNVATECATDPDTPTVAALCKDAEAVVNIVPKGTVVSGAGLSMTGSDLAMAGGAVAALLAMGFAALTIAKRRRSAEE